jgi:hypothetical protein
MVVVSAEYPVIITVFLFLLGTTVLTYCFGILVPNVRRGTGVNCLAVRTHDIESWRGLAYAQWRNIPLLMRRSERPDILVIILLYLDSYLFVMSTSILQVGVGINANYASCE